MNKEATIVISLAVVFFVLFGAFVYFSQPLATSTKTASDPALLVHANSAMTGTTTAKVTLVEFGDYQCPACGQAYPVLKQVTDAYASNPNFNFVFRNFPLPQHPNAIIGAEAAEAAGAQGKYWQMHDALYVHQNDWVNESDPTAKFAGYAKDIALDVTTFKADLASHKYQPFVLADKADAATLNLDHTPTIFLNGTEVQNITVADLKKQIDAALAK